jgi:cell fate regulator YaaT (PSP1 superfamily)
MFYAIQVRTREVGKIVYCEVPQELKTPQGTYVIIELDRGLDYGQVLTDIQQFEALPDDEALKKVVRVVTKEDLVQIEKNKSGTKEAHLFCNKKIQEKKLQMNLVGVEYSFDRSKLIFYFTAEGRVDFRELVKELASHFKARIELKQIGVRDEARFVGGFGPCGRQLCCAKFLKDFEPVTIKMAKEQNLPLNPTKISGLCGRLMCCLNYEYETYKELLKGLPKQGSKIKTKDGKTARVLSVNPLTRSVIVETDEKTQTEIKY